jgi:ABC-type transporter Mla subunit MlaD
LGDYDKALEYLNIALEIRKDVLGESHPYTQQTLQNIAIVKQKLEESQGKTEEPEVAQEIQQNKTEEPKKKKGFWSKLFGK